MKTESTLTHSNLSHAIPTLPQSNLLLPKNLKSDTNLTQGTKGKKEQTRQCKMTPSKILQTSGLSSVSMDQSNSESYALNSKTAPKPIKIPSVVIVNAERMELTLLNRTSET